MEEILSAAEAETLPSNEPIDAEYDAAESGPVGDDVEVEPTTLNAESTESVPEAESPSDDEQLLTVKFNKQLRSLSRESATTYAQKGMKYEAISPLLDTLKYVAASEEKTLAEFVEAIRSQHEEALFSRLMERYGDEEVAKELLELEKSKHQAAYEALLEREKNEENETEEAVTKRMAEEFDALRREFPQYSDFGKLPKAVVREAVERGIPLLDAQLRYEHRERVKADRAKADQESAARASTGAQSSGGAPFVSKVEAALLKGLWGS